MARHLYLAQTGDLKLGTAFTAHEEHVELRYVLGLDLLPAPHPGDPSEEGQPGGGDGHEQSCGHQPLDPRCQGDGGEKHPARLRRPAEEGPGFPGTLRGYLQVRYGPWQKGAGTMLALLALSGTGTVLYIIAAVLVIAGIVTLIQGGVVMGIVLIILGLLVGPGGVSIFTD